MINYYELLYCIKCEEETNHHLHEPFFGKPYLHCVYCNNRLYDKPLIDNAFNTLRERGAKKLGNYANQIKVLMPPDQFYNKLKDVTRPLARAFNVTLYYLGCRLTEARNIAQDDLLFDQDGGRIFFTIHRLKKSKQTPPLPLYLDSPFVKELWGFLVTSPIQPFKMSRKAGYNIVLNAMGFYPHYYRMNRISQFLKDNKSILEIQNWFGISLRAIDYYITMINLEAMGKDLK